MTPQQFIEEKLQNRQQTGLYRQLQPPGNLVDFCSNDYLGFARSAVFKQNVNNELAWHSLVLNGSTGSRLLTGNSVYAEELEKQLAQYHHAEAGLLFNSGYDANLGLLSSLPQRGDTVIHDELAHASIIDGIRLSHAKRYSFAHNNLDSLAKKLKASQGTCYIVVESVYSMDGDLAPLAAIASLAKQYHAGLIVDEAHALGVFDKGLVEQLQLQHAVLATVITFGKALGCHGAIVLGSLLLRRYLINFARSFIYTTAAPVHQLVTIQQGYRLLSQSAQIITRLRNHINLYKSLMKDVPQSSQSESAIQTLMIGGNENTRRIAIQLQQSGFDVRAILSPTVPKGTERLRICLHAFNTSKEIKDLTTLIKLFIHAQ